MTAMNSGNQTGRERRRRRRVRNQLVSYIVIVIFVAALAAGGILGAGYLLGNRDKEEEVLSAREQIEQILESEEPIVMEQSGEKPEEPTQEELLETMIEEQIAAMTLEEKAAGLFIVSPESITGVTTAVQAGDGTREALEKYAVGGIIYSSKNIQSSDQLKSMISNTRSFSRYPLFIAVEEEGGSVSRIAGSGLAQKVDSADKIGQTALPENAYEAGVFVGDYLSALGFDVNLAPVADLKKNQDSYLKDRTYGTDAAAVCPFVTEMMRGLQEQEVTACLKYFPGTGSADADVRSQISAGRSTAEEFRKEEFQVFQAGIDAGAKMIMVGHMAAPSLTGDQTPCSMSEEVVSGILRKELGFEGVIISDAMNSAAITGYYSSDQAAISSMKAGCDMILLPENFTAAYEAVLQAVREGVISEERINDSLTRIYRIKFQYKAG